MKKTINRLHLRGKIVLIRVDFNVPIKNKIVQDTSRISAALPTILSVIRKGGKPVLLSHLGRPKPGERNSKLKMMIVGLELRELLRAHNVEVVMGYDCVGTEVERQALSLTLNQVLLLENLRFYPEETSKNAEERMIFAQKLAKIGNVYIMDAFGNAHRKHASCYEINKLLPSAVGFLVEKELRFLQSLRKPEKPFMLLLGGVKISNKIPLIAKLVDLVDHILIGGGMAYTFFKAQGHEIGNSVCEEALVDGCKILLKRYGDKIVLPKDVRVGTFNPMSIEVEGFLKTVPVSQIPPNLQGLDIGEKTVEQFTNILAGAKTIVWNGPMGIYECNETATGTRAMAQAMINLTSKEITTIIGGGDSAAAVRGQIEKAKKRNDAISHVSTGGGAFLEALEGKTLPGLELIQDND